MRTRAFKTAKATVDATPKRDRACAATRPPTLAPHASGTFTTIARSVKVGGHCVPQSQPPYAVGRALTASFFSGLVCGFPSQESHRGYASCVSKQDRPPTCIACRPDTFPVASEGSISYEAREALTGPRCNVTACQCTPHVKQGVCQSICSGQRVPYAVGHWCTRLPSGETWNVVDHACRCVASDEHLAVGPTCSTLVDDASWTPSRRDSPNDQDSNPACCCHTPAPLAPKPWNDYDRNERNPNICRSWSSPRLFLIVYIVVVGASAAFLAQPSVDGRGATVMRGGCARIAVRGRNRV
jgi:hypothetical protein